MDHRIPYTGLSRSILHLLNPWTVEAWQSYCPTNDGASLFQLTCSLGSAFAAVQSAIYACDASRNQIPLQLACDRRLAVITVCADDEQLEQAEQDFLATMREARPSTEIRQSASAIHRFYAAQPRNVRGNYAARDRPCRQVTRIDGGV